MSDSITINGKSITPPKRFSCASSLFVVAHAFYAATPKKGVFGNTIEVKKEDLLSLQNEVETAGVWLNSSINCLGQLMTDISYEEIETSALKNLGHLIAELSELQILVKKTDEMMSSSRKGES